MTRIEFFFPVFVIVISGWLERVIGSPFKLHRISMGGSPFNTLHTAEICSPQLAGSSLMENGAICGATRNNIRKAISILVAAVSVGSYESFRIDRSSSEQTGERREIRWNYFKEKTVEAGRKETFSRRTRASERR